MNFTPVLDRILLRKIVAPQQTPGGTIIPDKYQESNKYEVVALGDFVVLGGERIPLTDFLSVGDVVLVSQYNVERVELETDSGISQMELWLARVQDVKGKSSVENRPRASAAVPGRVSNSRH